MIHVKKIIFHAADSFLNGIFDKLNATEYPLYTTQQKEVLSAERQSILTFVASDRRREINKK